MSYSVQLIPCEEIDIRNPYIFKALDELRTLKNRKFVIIKRLPEYTISIEPILYLCVRKDLLQLLKNKKYRFDFENEKHTGSYAGSYVNHINVFVVFDNEIDKFEFSLKR